MTGNRNTAKSGFDVYLDVEEQMKGKKIRIVQSNSSGSYCWGTYYKIRNDRQSINNWVMCSAKAYTGEIDIPYSIDKLEISLQANCYLYEIQPVVNN